MSKPADIPPGFVLLQHGDARAIVHEDHADALTAALFHHAHCTPLNTEGRAEVYTFPLHTPIPPSPINGSPSPPSSGERDGVRGSLHQYLHAHPTAVLRTLRRGGLAALALNDTYLTNRPLQEFHIHHAIHAAGVPCVEPLGVTWRRRGLFYSGAIATRYIPGESLFALLLRGGDNTAALQAAGRAIRALHEAGALHRDLHPANILVAQGVAYLLDFDGARMLAHAGPAERASNLLRLRRAFIKHGESAAFDVLLEAYGAPIDAAPWQQALAAIHEVKVRILADR